MAKNVLVAGATGALGIRVVQELARRGEEFRVRALVRDKQKSERLAAEPGLGSAEVFAGDATRPETLRGCCDGAELLISALGAPLSLRRTAPRVSFRDVDYEGNKNLLAEALRAGVRKFVYVSVHSAEKFSGLEYARSHEDFVRELRGRGIDHAVVRPTGFFSAFGEILKMARGGRVALVGSGESRTNPIDERDLAQVCVDALAGGRREIEAGGPEVLTRREVAEFAFAALGRPPKILSVPPWAFGLTLPALKLFDARLHALFSFFVAVSQTDVVAPAHGTRRLRNFFAEQAGQFSGNRV